MILREHHLETKARLAKLFFYQHLEIEPSRMFGVGGFRSIFGRAGKSLTKQVVAPQVWTDTFQLVDVNE